MTLSDFALLVDAPPKWVLNTRAVVGRAVRYTVPVAERLALARVLNRDLEMPLPRAWSQAGEALATEGLFIAAAGDGAVTVAIDVHRIRSAVAIRRSQLATMYQRRRAGRKPRRASSAVAAAQAYGLDVTLLQANLQRTPAVRLRQLDAMAAFPSRVRRKR